ncbi:hypothetical protein B0H16DRAFT_1614362, partial [Mycena metata]
PLSSLRLLLTSCSSPQLSLARLHRPSPQNTTASTQPSLASPIRRRRDSSPSRTGPASSPWLAPLTVPPPAAPSASSPYAQHRRCRLPPLSSW